MVSGSHWWPVRAAGLFVAILLCFEDLEVIIHRGGGEERGLLRREKQLASASEALGSKAGLGTV